MTTKPNVSKDAMLVTLVAFNSVQLAIQTSWTIVRVVRTVRMDVRVISGSVMVTGGRPLLAKGILSWSDSVSGTNSRPLWSPPTTPEPISWDEEGWFFAVNSFLKPQQTSFRWAPFDRQPEWDEMEGFQWPKVGDVGKGFCNSIMLKLFNLSSCQEHSSAKHENPNQATFQWILKPLVQWLSTTLCT